MQEAGHTAHNNMETDCMNHRVYGWSTAVLAAFSLTAPAWAHDGLYLRLDT